MMYYYMHLHRKFHPDPLSGLKIRRGSIKDMFDCVINFKTEKSEPSRPPSSGAAVHRYDKTSQKQLFYTCRWIYLIKYWYWGLSIKWKVSEQGTPHNFRSKNSQNRVGKRLKIAIISNNFFSQMQIGFDPIFVSDIQNDIFLIK